MSKNEMAVKYLLKIVDLINDGSIDIKDGELTYHPDLGMLRLGHDRLDIRLEIVSPSTIPMYHALNSLQGSN